MSVNIASSKTIGFAFDNPTANKSGFLATSYSTTSILPGGSTGSPVSRTFTIDSGLYHIVPGMSVYLDTSSIGGAYTYLSGTVTSYNSGTGQMVGSFTSYSNGVGGSPTSWSVACGGQVYKLFECPSGEYYFLKNIRIAVEGGANDDSLLGYITSSLRIVPSGTYGGSGSTFATTNAKLGGFYQKTMPFISGTDGRWHVENNSDLFSKYIITPGDVIYFEIGGQLSTATANKFSTWHVDMIASLEARF